MGRYQSGQMDQTVNLMPSGFAGSNPALPKLNFEFKISNFETVKF